MHLPSGFTPLVAFLALLAKTTAQDSAPFELKSHVLHPPNPSLDGLYFTAAGYHPGPFFFGALAEPSDAYPALVSVLTGTAGNKTLVTNSIDGFEDAYIAIEPGSTDTPAVYDSVQLIPDVPTTYGLHFVNDVLKWKDVKGSFYACLQNPPLPPEEITPPPGVYLLFYKPAGNPTPANCSTLQLIREPTS